MSNQLPNKYSQDDLDELWFASQLKVWRQIKKAVKVAKDLGVDNKDLADRIDMDPGQFSRYLSGDRNVTMRTMHNIARAVDCRLEVKVQPLAELRSLYPTSGNADAKDQATATSGAYFLNMGWLSPNHALGVMAFNADTSASAPLALSRASSQQMEIIHGE